MRRNSLAVWSIASSHVTWRGAEIERVVRGGRLVPCDVAVFSAN